MAEGNFYFEQDGDVFHPTPLTRGPWDPKTMHGRYVSGLLAHAVEVAHGRPEFQVSRLTIDLFRAPLRQPVSVETSLVRDGNRIRVADSSIHFVEDGSLMARASIVMLKRATPPEGDVWSPAIEPMPDPEALEPQDSAGVMNWKPNWESRRVVGDIQGLGPKRVWLREVNELVAGVALTPVVRIALAADLTNPFSNGGTHGLNYVNADVSVHMVRDPEGEWIGLDTAAHHAAGGIAVGECILHDVRGPLGRASVCGVANTHRA
jgi:hypothetical protein